MADVAAGTAFLEIVGSNSANSQGIIQFSDGQQSGVGGDGSTAKLQLDFWVELKSERGLVTVTHQVPLGLLRYLKKHTKLMSVLYRIYCQIAHETTPHVRKLLIYRRAGQPIKIAGGEDG